MQNVDFIPIILGTDINAYGTARSFHEAYGVHSVALGRTPLPFTQNSKIVTVKTFEGFDTEEIFPVKMIELGKELQKEGKPLVLISCSDGYTTLITQFSEILEPYYEFNYISKEWKDKLENKKDFYEICEEYGLDYPDTYIVSKDNKENIQLPFGFPCAVKPNDSIEFLYLQFEGKMKAYKAESQEELEKIVEDIYNAGYTGELIVQDYIPGDSSTMGVLNAYVNRRGEVKMMCFARCLLDECLPESIGNYNALLTEDAPDVYKKYEKFLLDIGYRGFANFDFKYDARDGKYKIFEINIRQGRSSFYMTAAGCNFVTFLVDDVVYHADKETLYYAEPYLWLYVDPKVLLKYVNPKDKSIAEKYIREKKYKFTQWYEKDKSLWRYLFYWRRRIATRRYYPIYQDGRD